MKRRKISVLAVLMALLVATVCVTQTGCSSAKRRTLKVTATGSATEQAEVAVVHVGYRLYGPDVQTTYADAVETSQKILHALLQSGIKKNAVESTSQVVTRTDSGWLSNMPWNLAEKQRKAFTAVQGWTVRVNPDDAAKALNTAIRAGANESGWIGWRVNDPAKLRAEAAARAMAEAKVIAARAAREAGVQLGSVVKASENTGRGEGFAGGILAGLGAASPGMNASIGYTTSNVPLAIRSRRVVQHATLDVTYSIE